MTLIGGAGRILDGGTGFDTANYSGALSAVTVHLDGTNADRAAMQRATCSPASSRLSARPMPIRSPGATANETIYGGAGGDILFGMSGNDTLYGEAGNDIGRHRRDGIDGGAGTDTATYASSLAGVISISMDQCHRAAMQRATC